VLFLPDSPEKRWEYWEDLPPEKEEELIEKIAQFAVKHKMGLIAEMLIDSGGPLTSTFANLGLTLFGPFLEFLGADTYTALFRKRENVKRLIERIEKLEEEERSKGEKQAE